MFQKPMFGPKNEKFEEIHVNFSKEIFLPPNKEDSEEDNATPKSKKNTIRNPEECFLDLVKKKSFPDHPKSK